MIEKFKCLTDGGKLTKIFNAEKIFLQKIKSVKVSILKSYRDSRSYSLAALYKIYFVSGQLIEAAGSANSDGGKEYGFKIAGHLWENFRYSPDFIIPKPFGYIKEYGLFLRQYLSGQTAAELIKKNKGLSRLYLKRITKWLAEFQKIPATDFIWPLMNFHDIENNLLILKNRREDVARLQKEYETLRAKIAKYNEYLPQVAVHGDFNPSNIIIRKRQLAIIDFEKMHFGDRLEDTAGFASHLKNMEALKIDKKARARLSEEFIASFEKEFGAMDERQKERFETYVNFFDLLLQTHKLIWQ